MTLPPPAIEAAARRLDAARRGDLLLDGLPEGERPADLDDAYAIQARVVALSGEPVAGWFLGCTNPEIQRQLGLAGPYFGRLLANRVHESPARLEIAGHLPVVLEVEFAFRLGRDLPPRGTPYTTAEVVAAIASVHPAIEVVISHFRDWTGQDIHALVADNGTDGALVYGAGTRCEPARLAASRVSLTVNGTREREGTGSDVSGGPLAALSWLANERARRGEGLAAGQIHNTGSCTSMYWARRGDVAVAEFEGVGTVSVEIP